MNRTNREIISLNIDLISYQDALAQIVVWGRDKKPSYVCFANVHMAIEAYENKDFASNVNGASLILPDGMPIVKSIQYIHGKRQERVAGMDAFPDLLRLAEENALKVFFFGSTIEVLEKIRFRARKQFPKLNIAGSLSPPFNRSLDDDTYIDSINNSGADIVFVALGCPKQEKWMATHTHKINATLLGVGGAFPVFAGISTRAPFWMQRLGLEWLFRLGQEPTRLFKRYLKTNTLFILLLLRIKMHGFLEKGMIKKKETNS
jgi:N-acetylglucosaminyldiphosphoundecaprenol N-acetyl-beta-D-mannosaminyltransferase